MMTAKATVVLMVAYLLALAAGTTSGLLAERLGWTSTPHSSAVSPLAAQLHLTPQQTQDMRAIWEGVSQSMDKWYAQAQQINRQRDQALVEMLNDDQKAKFAIIDKGYAKQFNDLVALRDEAFRQALIETEAMLSDTQRAKYEEIVRQRIGRLPAQAGATTEPSVDDLRP